MVYDFASWSRRSRALQSEARRSATGSEGSTRCGKRRIGTARGREAGRRAAPSAGVACTRLGYRMVVKLTLDDLLEWEYSSAPLRDHCRAPDTGMAASGTRYAVRSRAYRRGVMSDVHIPVLQAARVPAGDHGRLVACHGAGVTSAFEGEPHGHDPGD
jgi:hypothetical protein